VWGGFVSCCRWFGLILSRAVVVWGLWGYLLFFPVDIWCVLVLGSLCGRIVYGVFLVGGGW